MATLGRVLFSSAQRIDLPDLESIESYVATDFKYLIQSLVGDEESFIIRGFDVINPADCIGSQTISVRVADSAVFFPMSTAGCFYYGLPAGSSTSAPLVPDLKKNATNYIYLTLTTLDTAKDTRAFWDPDKEAGLGGEFTQDVNTESALIVDINTSTSAFPIDTIPVCKVVVGTSVITSIQDCRQLFFTLGTGGSSPNPSANYNFKSLPSVGFERTGTQNLINSGTGDNPFQGADKNLYSLKEWMDVVMTKIKEIGGTTYWYEDASSFNAATLFSDLSARNIKSKGQWEHSLVTEGLLSWTETIELQSTNDPRNILIRSGSKTLANDQVLYVESERNLPINSAGTPVTWVVGANYVNGDTGLFENLSLGDWIRPESANNSYYVRVVDFNSGLGLSGSSGATAANAKSIQIDGISTFDAELVTTYTKGTYIPTELGIAYRNDPVLAALGGNFYWLAMRSDTINKVSAATAYSVSGNVTKVDGSNARIECSVAHGLVDGDYITITSGSYAGTYAVEIESSTVFYIQSSVTSIESVAGFFAIVTTSDRTDPGTGFLLESANHGFESGQIITIAGTSQYNGQFNVNVRSATQFNIPMASLPSAETPLSATATLNKISIRTESGVGRVIRGESRTVGSPETVGLMNYIGMQSPDQNNPLYLTPDGFNARNGEADFNSSPSDNLTTRAARLTAMMADKSQDKAIVMAGENIDSITNTTSGSDQIISFSGTGPKLTVNMPGSFGGYVGLAGILTLAEGQAAYFRVDRNQTFSVLNLSTLLVDDIDLVPVEENIFIFAIRDSSSAVYLWNGNRVGIGTYPYNQALSQEILVREGVVSENSYEEFFSTRVIAASDSYPAAISKIDLQLADFLDEVALEESAEVGAGGTTTFTATTLMWSPLNTKWDVLVFVNGVKQEQDVTGGVLQDYKKTSSTSIQFNYTVPEYARITVRVERPLLAPSVPGFFRYDSNGYGGVAAFTPTAYATGTEQLQVFRNGVGLIHSAILGNPIDRYTEASANTVTLGSACPTSETLYFINLPAIPDYREFITGETTTTITIPSYSGSNRLMVFRNGILMNKSSLGDPADSYTEASPTTIELDSTAASDEVFGFLHLASAPTNRAESDTLAGATISVGFSYTNGNRKLLVFRNGVLLNNNSLGGQVDQYTEPGIQGSSQSTIVLEQAATLGEVFTFILLG